MDVDPSTVRKHIARMERDGIIRREYRFNAKKGGQEANAYHFTGLIKAATPFAKEALQTREQRKSEDANRRKRKKPMLVVNNTGKSGSPNG
jgi:hypothetical protein